jgi:hypothetical protein
MPTCRGTDYRLDTTTTSPLPVSEDEAGGGDRADAQNSPGFQDGELYSSASLLMEGADVPPEYSPADLSELNNPPSDPEEGNVDGRSRFEVDVAATTRSRSLDVETRGIDQDVV